MMILIIDGQGGKLGRTLVEGVRKSFPDSEIAAVGTNSAASGNMLKGGASYVATGENAVIRACRRADIIAGPLGIAMADALMGEISPAMANAVSQSLAKRVLIPMNLCETYIAGTLPSSAAIVEDALSRIKRLIEGER